MAGVGPAGLKGEHSVAEAPCGVALVEQLYREPGAWGALQMTYMSDASIGAVGSCLYRAPAILGRRPSKWKICSRVCTLLAKRACNRFDRSVFRTV
jgi:hypothetical protein